MKLVGARERPNSVFRLKNVFEQEAIFLVLITLKCRVSSALLE